MLEVPARSSASANTSICNNLTALIYWASPFFCHVTCTEKAHFQQELDEAAGQALVRLSLTLEAWWADDEGLL